MIAVPLTAGPALRDHHSAEPDAKAVAIVILAVEPGTLAAASGDEGGTIAQWAASIAAQVARLDPSPHLSIAGVQSTIEAAAVGADAPAPRTLEVRAADDRSASRAPAGAPGPGLSRRELEVLRLIADDHRDHEIAACLSTSLRTVNSQVAGILNKLGVRSRTAAAVYAVRHGLA